MVELSFTKNSNFHMWKKLNHLYLLWLAEPITETTKWVEYLKKNYNCNIINAKSTYSYSQRGGMVHSLMFDNEEQATIFLLSNG